MHFLSYSESTVLHSRNSGTRSEPASKIKRQTGPGGRRRVCREMGLLSVTGRVGAVSLGSQPMLFLESIFIDLKAAANGAHPRSIRECWVSPAGPLVPRPCSCSAPSSLADGPARGPMGRFFIVSAEPGAHARAPRVRTGRRGIRRLSSCAGHAQSNCHKEDSEEAHQPADTASNFTFGTASFCKRVALTSAVHVLSYPSQSAYVIVRPLAVLAGDSRRGKRRATTPR